ncbi:MAG: hypothetical protein RL069_1149, partial [Planctomycetota bacterium]
NQPNFVFIFVDDQPWNGTSVQMIHGQEFSRTASFRMPNLERLAANGMVFSQAYASHPKCECSRAALLMGRSTTSLNAVDKSSRNWNASPGDSLPNSLKRANPNYRAAHFGKWQWHQAPESMGYDQSDGITFNTDGDSADPNDPKQSFGITRRAKAFIESQVANESPFYIQLSYYAPHAKPQALASTLKKYESHLNPLMAAMNEDLDTCIGDLVGTLRNLGVVDKTYIFYMSDNGGNTGVLKGGKSLVDEGGLRVPLIASGPGIQASTYCNEPVVGYDLLATILDIATPNAKLPSGVEGGSWKEVLHNGGKGQVHRPIDRLVFHHDVEVPHPQTAIRKGDLKLIHYWDTKESFLYDLSVDLREKNDLANQRRDETQAMLSELKEHLRQGLERSRYEQLESGKPIQSERPQREGKPKPGRKKTQPN